MRLAGVELAKIAFHSFLQQLRLLVVGADDQDSVVASDGTDDLGPVFVVDASCDWLRSARGCDEHQLIHGLANLNAEAAQHFANAWQAVLVEVRGFTTCAGTWSGAAVNYFGEFLTYEAAREPASFAPAP